MSVGRFAVQIRYKAHSLNMARVYYTPPFMLDHHSMSPNFDQEFSIPVSNAALQSIHIELQAPDRSALNKFTKECERRRGAWEKLRAEGRHYAASKHHKQRSSLSMGQVSPRVMAQVMATSPTYVNGQPLDGATAAAASAAIIAADMNAVSNGTKLPSPISSPRALARQQRWGSIDGNDESPAVSPRGPTMPGTGEPVLDLPWEESDEGKEIARIFDRRVVVVASVNVAVREIRQCRGGAWRSPFGLRREEGRRGGTNPSHTPNQPSITGTTSTLSRGSLSGIVLPLPLASLTNNNGDPNTPLGGTTSPRKSTSSSDTPRTIAATAGSAVMTSSSTSTGHHKHNPSTTSTTTGAGSSTDAAEIAGAEAG
jgi:hypothetical protein